MRRLLTCAAFAVFSFAASCTSVKADVRTRGYLQVGTTLPVWPGYWSAVNPYWYYPWGGYAEWNRSPNVVLSINNSNPIQNMPPVTGPAPAEEPAPEANARAVPYGFPLFEPTSQTIPARRLLPSVAPSRGDDEAKATELLGLANEAAERGDAVMARKIVDTLLRQYPDTAAAASVRPLVRPR